MKFFQTKYTKGTIVREKGFTLIEIMVASSIFVIVMVIAVGAVISAIDANRKAQSLNAVINNLSLTFESMIRDLRTGSSYSKTECTDFSSDSCVAFLDKDGNNIMYEYHPAESTIVKTDVKNPSGSGRITSQEVTLQTVSFILQGNSTNDGPQRILLHIQGYAGNTKTRSDFNVETLITSRSLDIKDFH